MSIESKLSLPTETVELPSKGLLYPKDNPLSSGVIEMKYMTAKEEDILSNPNYIRQGTVFDKLLSSLIVSKINYDDLTIGDKNAVLMAARKSAYGSDYQFDLSCPHCTTNNTINASLDNVESKEILEDETAKYSEEGNMIITLPKSGAVVEIRILSTDDERIIEETTKKRLKNSLPAEELLTRYRRMFVSVNGSTDTSVINNFINNLLGIADSRFLRKKYLDLAPDISFTYTSKCSGCGELLEGGVPIGVDFFWPKLWFY